MTDGVGNSDQVANATVSQLKAEAAVHVAEEKDNRPIAVDPRLSPIFIRLVVAQIAIVAGAVTTLVGLFYKRDWLGFVNFVQSDALIPLLGALTFFIGLSERIWRAIRGQKVQVTAAVSAPNDKVIVATPAEVKEIGLDVKKV